MISSIFVMKEGQQRLLTLPDGHLGRESGDVVRFSVVFAVSVPGSAACWSGLGLLGGIPASWELQSDPLLKNRIRPVGIPGIARGMDAGL